MVAAYEIGEPVRSFVLVPGTGTDRGAKPLCLDLARSSSVAGAVAVQSTVPSAIPVGNLKPSDQSEGNGDADKKTDNQENNLPSASHTQPGPVTMVRQASPGGIKRSLQTDEDDVKESLVSAPVTKMLKKETATDSSSVVDPEVVELRRKCEELQQQNTNLNRRLAMFHDLFRSKERLANFVKFLETS